MSGADGDQSGDRNNIQVIGRAADVLRALAQHPRGMGLAELTEQVELPRSTVHRIVKALAAEELVYSPKGGRTRIGPGLIRLVAGERLDLRGELRPHLEELSSQLGETVDLAVLDGASVLFLDQVSAPQRLQAVSAVGSVFPAYCTANGKALLADLPLQTVQQLLPARLPARTPTTITSRAKLEEELRTVRRRGYAFDREEHTTGISAVGATVRDSFGAEAAIAVPLPTQRFIGREEEIATLLRETCDRIERELGTGNA